VLLTRCRDCSSKLLQLDGMWLVPDGRQVARRRSPECETVDLVTASPEPLWAWRRLARQQRDALAGTVRDLVAGVAELEPSRCSGSRRSSSRSPRGSRRTR
jgi:hypothetical protein